MQVNIVTPQRKMVEGAQASAIKLPGAKGEMEILEGHADLVSTLTTGEVAFAGRKFAVSYGFVEVRDGAVTLLAETCEESTEIDVARAKKSQQIAEEKMGATLPPEHFKKYELKLQRAILRQHVAR